MARILIVDDSPVEIKIIRHFLDEQYEFLEAGDGQTALALVMEAQPDLILLDILMPGMDGLEVCRRLKAEARTAAIPVVFITAVAASQSIADGFAAGGQDYITKPFCASELSTRIKAQLTLRRSQLQLLEYAEELEEKNAQLQSLLQKVEQQNRTDFLTGLASRRHMTECIKKEAARCRETKGQAAIILADVDDFKHVNDTYGHDCGDVVLKTLAANLRALLRADDLLARWGGEEFLFLLHNTNLAQGVCLAERIRAAVAEAVFYHKEETFFVTITLGVSELNAGADFDEALKKADEAMYCGKGGRKNCVISVDRDV